MNFGTGDVTNSGGVVNNGTIGFNSGGNPCGDNDDISITAGDFDNCSNCSTGSDMLAFRPAMRYGRSMLFGDLFGNSLVCG